MDFTVNFMIIMQSYITKQIKALEYAHLKPQFAQMDRRIDFKWKNYVPGVHGWKNQKFLDIEQKKD